MCEWTQKGKSSDLESSFSPFENSSYPFLCFQFFKYFIEFSASNAKCRSQCSISNRSYLFFIETKWIQQMKSLLYETWIYTENSTYPESADHSPATPRGTSTAKYKKVQCVVHCCYSTSFPWGKYKRVPVFHEQSVVFTGYYSPLQWTWTLPIASLYCRISTSTTNSRNTSLSRPKLWHVVLLGHPPLTQSRHKSHFTTPHQIDILLEWVST